MAKMRIFKLGNLDHKVMPSEAVIAKLEGILKAAPRKGNDIEFVWGPDLEVIELELGDGYRDVEIIVVPKGGQ